MRTRSFPVRSSVLAQACLGVLTVASGASPAVAQELTLEASAGLEEIVVTARRREEALQDTPVAVSAFSGEALEIRGVKNIADVGQLVPNVQFDSVAPEAAGGGASALSIRGIGQSDYVITIEPGVGVYLDGVYISKSFGSLLDTIDVEQIEVLRGPQGTLFGKNTIGGAIVVTSRRPTAEPDFYAEVTTGEFNRFDFKGAVSGPLGDSFRARLSGAVQSTDGYVDRVTTGDTQGNIDRQAVRLVTEWDVTDDLLATFAVDGTRIREENAPIVVLTLSETAPFALYHNFVEYPECNPFIPGNDARFSDSDCYNSQYTSSLEDRNNYSNGPNYADSNVYGANITLDWTTDWGGLKSITAFRRVEVQSGQEVDNVPTFDGNIYQDYDTNQWSQEFQLSGKAWSERLDYVVGAYYLNETGRQKFPIRTDFIEFTTGGEIDNDTYAIFGQASYQLTDALSLTAGVRWSEETKRFLPQQQIDYVPPQFQAPIPELGGAVLLPPVIPAAVGGQLSPFFQAGVPLLPSVEAEITDDQLSPMVSLDYKITDDVLAYGSYTQGFKGGGFTMRAFPPIIPGVTTTETDPEKVIPSFDPEEAKQFEIGLKSEWLDRSLRLNLAAFYIDYTDLQLTVLIGGFTPTVQNAGDATISGVELETEWAATNWLKLNAAVGYLDHEYDRLAPEAAAQGITLDSMIPNAPEWSINAGGTVDFYEGDRGRVFLLADYTYRSEMAKDPANTPEITEDGYSLVNASLNYESADSHWLLSVGARNLTDEAYIVTGVFNSGAGINMVVPSRPREWFATLRFEF